MRAARWLWPLGLLASAAAAGVLSNQGDSALAGMRLAVGLWFLFFCPGMALIRLLRLNDPLQEWGLAAALSVALDTIIAAGMLYASVWSPQGTLYVLIAITAAGALAQLAIPDRATERQTA